MNEWRVTFAGDDNEGEVFRPSAAFCKAMDKEQEYDDTDAMAMGERIGDPDGRPAGNTEVCCLGWWPPGHYCLGIVNPLDAEVRMQVADNVMLHASS